MANIICQKAIQILCELCFFIVRECQRIFSLGGNLASNFKREASQPVLQANTPETRDLNIYKNDKNRQCLKTF